MCFSSTEIRNIFLSCLPPVFSEASEEGETDLAHVRHVHEAESRAFHEEDIGRPAFGYEQFDRDFMIGDDGEGTLDQVRYFLRNFSLSDITQLILNACISAYSRNHATLYP